MKVWAKVPENFVRRFASDPDYIRDNSDIEAIERIDYEDRFPCHSPSEALSLVSELVPNEVHAELRLEQKKRERRSKILLIFYIIYYLFLL